MWVLKVYKPKSHHPVFEGSNSSPMKVIHHYLYNFIMEIIEQRLRKRAKKKKQILSELSVTTTWRNGGELQFQR